MNVLINRLTSDQEQSMHEVAAEWWSMLTRELPADRTAVENSIDYIYKDLNLSPPNIIWCESIAQLVAMHGLIAMLKVTDPVLSPPLAERFKNQIKDPWWKSAVERALQIAGLDVLPSCKSADLDKELIAVYGRRRTEAANKRRGAVALSIGKATGKDLGVSAKLAIRKHLLENRVPPLMNAGMLFLFTQRNRNNFAPITTEAFLNLLDDETQKIILKTILHTEKRTPVDRIIAPLFPMNNETVNLLQVHDGTAACTFMLDKLGMDVDPTYKALMEHWLCLKRNVVDYELFERVCLISEYPLTASLNARGQLHSNTAASMTFRDQYKIYSIDGVRVPSSAIESPITIEDIDKEENAEVRRIMIRRYGLEKYLDDSNAQVIDRDQFGTLYKKSSRNDEPLVVVRVTNPTPEPDGTHREYFLRVPPHITSAKAAVAWTFDLRPEEYALAVES
jgi:hypothetical protein